MELSAYSPSDASLVGDQIEPIVGKSYCVEALNRAEYW
jgi:hypothetical protein